MRADRVLLVLHASGVTSALVAALVWPRPQFARFKRHDAAAPLVSQAA